jgi:acetate kinase
MREVLAGLGEGDERCRLAFDVYSHRLAGQAAAMAASLGGLDALVFTGGIGENSPEVREETGRRLGFLGIEIDPVANQSAGGDRDVSATGAPARTLVLAAREDLEIAAGVRAALSDSL